MSSSTLPKNRIQVLIRSPTQSKQTRSMLNQIAGNIELLFVDFFWCYLRSAIRGLWSGFRRKQIQWFPWTNICYSWRTLRFLEWVSNLLLSNKGRINYKTISRSITTKNAAKRMLEGKYFSYWLINIETYSDRLSTGIWEIRKDDWVRSAENCINQR